MSFRLPTLYHWSPASRFFDISKQGLQVFSESEVSSKGTRWPYICFGFDPSSAWAISGEIAQERDEDVDDHWDLWELIEFPEKAEIHVNPQFGPNLKEVRFMTSVPVHMLWHVGRKGHQDIAYGSDYKPLGAEDFELAGTEMIYCPDQETIDTLLAITRTDHLLDAVPPDAIKRAAQNVINLIPNPEQEQ